MIKVQHSTMKNLPCGSTIAPASITGLIAACRVAGSIPHIGPYTQPSVTIPDEVQAAA